MYNNQAPRINNQYPQSNQFSNTNQNNQTSSAVPFSSQSYPNNPETPGYLKLLEKMKSSLNLSKNVEASLRRMVYGTKFDVIKSCLFRNLE